ncbi:hypothetical protein HBA55_21060 [Pseudomaricurvus alkylphenolicus]|uniref:hypothetical protein n=1 Tax=Pseudomaricurvus alkylphenolicus TaxID=1306991 RepID=UPI00141FE088|nr:hypothetical protein [Pseudomaricurvus alkylphenolicus]NIB42109.1 hypothetical protein [Pseudomaricurvus alkylphenolicus]
MEVKDFKSTISQFEPEVLTRECLYRDYVHALPEAVRYAEYINAISSDYVNSDHIAIMGSGNWGYSLNPEKSFRPFCEKSDIDVVIICPETFHEVWEELRDYHRSKYYMLNRYQRLALKRNGENVYSGFITPKWIPNKASPTRFQYDINTNNYSNESVGYRQVNMMFFKNQTEAIDYYVRGFRLAKRAIRDGL